MAKFTTPAQQICTSNRRSFSSSHRALRFKRLRLIAIVTFFAWLGASTSLYAQGQRNSEPESRYKLSFPGSDGMEISVVKSDQGDHYKLQVIFAVPTRENIPNFNLIRIYGFQLQDGKRFDLLGNTFPSVQGNWKSGDEVTFQVNLPKQFADPAQGWHLTFCVGSTAACVPAELLKWNPLKEEEARRKAAGQLQEAANRLAVNQGSEDIGTRAADLAARIVKSNNGDFDTALGGALDRIVALRFTIANSVRLDEQAKKEIGDLVNGAITALGGTPPPSFAPSTAVAVAANAAGRPIAGTVQGRVLWNEQPVIGAQVVATSEYGFSSTKYGSVTTDAQGQFSISGVPEGRKYLYVFGNQPAFWVSAVTPLQMVAGTGTLTADTYLCKGFDPVSPGKGATVGNRPILEWASYPDAADYAVRVLPTGQSSFVFSRGDRGPHIKDTRVQIDVDLVPGEYTWRVDAFNAAGHIIGCTFYPRTFTVIKSP